MRKLISACFITSALTVPLVVNAATSAELKLIGKIEPSSCIPNFTGGSTIEYGNIPASTLSSTAINYLPVKNTTLNIICDGPTKFAIGVSDERAATLVTGAGRFGLGAAPNNANIGGYEITFATGGGSGTDYPLESNNRGVSWRVTGGVIVPGWMYSYSKTGAPEPSSYTSIAQPVSFKAAIDKGSNLPLASQINIDGLTTFELVYL